MLSAIANPAPDAELLARYCFSRAGLDFSAIVNRHGPMVLRVCQRILRNRHDAEDAAQAVFLVLARRPEAVTRSLSGWLFKVAHACSLRIIRTQSRRLRRELITARTESPAAAPQTHELREELDAALIRLPARLREAVVLHYLEGRNHEEAAQLVGCTAGAFRLRSMKGLHRLRDLLGRRAGTCHLSALTALLSREALASSATTPWLLWNVSAAASTVTETGRPALIAQSVLQTLFWTRVKTYGLILSLVVLVTGASAAAVCGGPQRPLSPAADGQTGTRQPALLGGTAEPTALEQRIAAVLPRDSEERWLRQIPWRTDLAAARVEADRAGKALVLWLMDGHPLGLACDNAQWGRLTTFSDPRVIELLQKDFIPVAGHTAHLASLDPKERAWCPTSRWLEDQVAKSGMRKLHRGGSAQGCYILSASGQLLGAAGDHRQVPALLETTRAALAARPIQSNQAKVAQTSLGPAFPLPAGTAVLQVFCRMDPVPAETKPYRLNSTVGRDFCWIMRDEQEEIVRRLASANEADLPVNLAARLVRFHLIDTLRGVPIPFWQPEHVREHSFRIKRLQSGEVLTVQLTGMFALDMPRKHYFADETVPCEMALRGELEGMLEFDRKSATLRSAKLYATAEGRGQTTFAAGAPPGPLPLKFALVLSDDPLTRQVPPQGLIHYGRKDYFKPPVR